MQRSDARQNYSRAWDFDASGNPKGGTHTPATGTPKYLELHLQRRQPGDHL